jgi:hypothetical protein
MVDLSLLCKESAEMGNHPKPKKPWHDVSPHPIADPKPGGGGGPVEDPGPRPVTWRVVLQDVTSAAERLLPEVAVRGERAMPHFRVYAGENLVGYVPARMSATIGKAMDLAGGGALLGRVASVERSPDRVVVELWLGGV